LIGDTQRKRKPKTLAHTSLETFIGQLLCQSHTRFLHQYQDKPVSLIELYVCIYLTCVFVFIHVYMLCIWL